MKENVEGLLETPWFAADVAPHVRRNRTRASAASRTASI
jgi:hypothetical protein